MEKFQIISIVTSVILAICGVVNTYMGMAKYKKDNEDKHEDKNSSIEISGNHNYIMVDKSKREITQNNHYINNNQKVYVQPQTKNDESCAGVILAAVIGIIVVLRAYHLYKNIILIAFFVVSVVIFLMFLILSRKYKEDVMNKFIVMHMLLCLGTCFIPIIMTYELQAPIHFEEFYSSIVNEDGQIVFSALSKNNYLLYWTLQLISFVPSICLLYMNIRQNIRLIKRRFNCDEWKFQLGMLCFTMILITGGMYQLFLCIQNIAQFG